MWGSKSEALVPESKGAMGVCQAGSQCPGRSSCHSVQAGEEHHCFGLVWRPVALLLLEVSAITPNLYPQFIPSPHLPTDILVPATMLSHLDHCSSLWSPCCPPGLLASPPPQQSPRNTPSYPLNMCWGHVTHLLQLPVTSHCVWKKTGDVSTWSQGLHHLALTSYSSDSSWLPAVLSAKPSVSQPRGASLCSAGSLECSEMLA